MEKVIFDLLIEISENDFIDNEDKSIYNNRDKAIARNEKQRQLDYLLNQGFISKTNDIYVITEYGYNIAQFKSWNDYLIHQKSLIDKKIKKEHFDLKVSEFQARTKLLPYFISIISIIISIIAIFNPLKLESNQIGSHRQETTELNLKEKYEIKNLEKCNDYPSSIQDTIECPDWKLNKDEIKEILKNARQISGRDWHNDYGHWSCCMKADIIQDGIIYKLYVNAGAWLTISSDNETKYFGQFPERIEELFLSKSWKLEEME